MSAEKIIQRIKADAKKQEDEIIKSAEKQASEILELAKNEAEKEATVIISNGKKQSENLCKILLSKANQDSKRASMNAKETAIEECFKKATEKLSSLDKDRYISTFAKYMQKGQKRLGKQCRVLISKEEDRSIAKKLDIPVYGEIEAIGGIIMQSEDGQVTLDYTFEGIIAREKNKIRVKVGKLLFS
ncbi:MAG: V-type ATP synthase subunit E [Candidatus Thermoplasmatota archaeon]|nr:V-type ATP synthase subunit E [Candidatus Thermoplasmatota archaeon]